jgi:hypothetical protein
MLTVNSRNSGRPFRGINNNNELMMMMMMMMIIIIIITTTTTTTIIRAVWSWALKLRSYVGQKNTYLLTYSLEQSPS